MSDDDGGGGGGGGGDCDCDCDDCKGCFNDCKGCLDSCSDGCCGRSDDGDNSQRRRDSHRDNDDRGDWGDDDGGDDEGEENKGNDTEVDLRLCCGCCCSNWFAVLKGIDAWEENHSLTCSTRCYCYGCQCRCSDAFCCCCCCPDDGEPICKCFPVLDAPRCQSKWGGICLSCTMLCASVCPCSDKDVSLACSCLGWTCYPRCGCCVEEHDLWRRRKKIPFLTLRRQQKSLASQGATVQGMTTQSLVQPQAMQR